MNESLNRKIEMENIRTMYSMENRSHAEVPSDKGRLREQVVCLVAGLPWGARPNFTEL